MVLPRVHRLFVCALEIEAEPIIKYLDMIKADKKLLSELDNDEMNCKLHKFLSNFQVYITPDKYDMLVISGVGKILSSICTSYLLNLFNVDEIINIGLCGTINYKYHKGQILRVHKVIEHDLYLPDQLSHLNKNIPINIDITYRVTSNEAQCNFINTILCTGDKFVEDFLYREILIRNYNCDIVDMEGYSIAKIAKIFGVNIRIYKVISDNADSSSVGEFQKESIEDFCNKHITFLMSKI